MILVPMAFGLAVVYRPDALPPACIEQLHRLKTATDALGDFLRLVEANYISPYLFGKDMKQYADGLKRHTTSMEQTDAELLGHFNGLQSAYADLSTHSNSLLNDDNRLSESYRSLQNDRA